MVDGMEQSSRSGGEERSVKDHILDAYTQGDAGDRLALFLGYRDMRRAFRAVDLTQPSSAQSPEAKTAASGKRRTRGCGCLGSLLG